VENFNCIDHGEENYLPLYIAPMVPLSKYRESEELSVPDTGPKSKRFSPSEIPRKYQSGLYRIA